jgi:hypothetical protein
MDWWILTMVWAIACRTWVCAVIYSNILRSNDEVARVMLMLPSSSLPSWFMLELSIWLARWLMRLEWTWFESIDEHEGGRYKRRTQLSNWYYCRCKIHNTPTLTSKNQHKQCHKTKIIMQAQNFTKQDTVKGTNYTLLIKSEGILLIDQM